jgi:osmotically-inducible protein OsmY
MRTTPATLSLALSLCLLPGMAGGAEKEQPPAPAIKQDNPVTNAPVRRNTGGPGDYGLREKLVKRLTGEPDLGRGLRIVMVNGGAVFSGTVPTWSLKRRALVMAGTIRGIVNVTDQAQVPRGSVTDEQILTAITNQLKDLKEVFGIPTFEVEVHDGVVTLQGTVKDFATRVRVEEVAGSVGGVTQIVNRMRPVNAPSAKGDAPLRAAVASYLRNPREFAYHGEIEVQVKDATVVLTGRLPYFLARQQAGAMAALVEGVAAVENRITVDPSVIIPAIAVRELP